MPSRQLLHRFWLAIASMTGSRARHSSRVSGASMIQSVADAGEADTSTVARSSAAADLHFAKRLDQPREQRALGMGLCERCLLWMSFFSLLGGLRQKIFTKESINRKETKHRQLGTVNKMQMLCNTGTFSSPFSPSCVSSVKLLSNSKLKWYVRSQGGLDGK